jgi:glycosyltransferase involved in cell wall biosynthesis
MPASSPLFSIIVPVFNQWDLVPGLLACLKAQSLPREHFEVLLVDNGSDNVPAPDNEPEFVSRLFCPAPGSYATRNLGAAHARGKLLAFTDADCQPHPEWLREISVLWNSLGSEKVIVAGAITIVPRDKARMNYAELYDTVMGIPQQNYVRRGYGATANLTVAKTVFDQLGGFDARRFSGGDAEFCRRAAAQAGISLHYGADAVVFHPARDSMDALLTKVRRIKGGQVTAGSVYKRVENVFRAFLPPSHACRRALRSRSFTWSQRLTVCLIQMRLWLAGMAEVVRLLVFRRKPERR